MAGAPAPPPADRVRPRGVRGRRGAPTTSSREFPPMPLPLPLPPALRAAALALAASFALLRATETDDRIVKTARDSYNFRTYLADDDIRIVAKAGAITLTGQVLDEFHRSLAEETLAGLPGVRSVNNQLSLKAVPGGINPDTTLRARVLAALLFHRDLSTARAEVAVSQGVVTLRGEAASPTQRKHAGEFVQGLDGVVRVVNEMTVARPPRPRGRSIPKKIDDASITAQVKLALLFDRSTSALRTRVHTENGVVFLSGQARTPAERERVRRIFLNIEGIKAVRNQITLPPG